KAVLITDPEGNQSLTEIEIQAHSDGDCLPINDRQTSHWINLTLPQKIREGRYRLQLDFCRRPFEQMPLKIISNEFEVFSPEPEG
ncbi:MAG: hypothetical protein HY787_10980, partial [Deltaproteobacteria bacterium]|nr:hypothetical protein [Deltaproteobacteria bacterium]